MTERTDAEDLNVELTKAMSANLHEIARIIGPRTRFTPMLGQYGAVEAWRRLRGETSGFTDLWMAGRLDLSLEALIIEHPKFHSLFTPDELAEMRKSLNEYHYAPRDE